MEVEGLQDGKMVENGV